MILAIETATPVCSVALQLKSGRVTEKRIEGFGVHSERTFTFADELLERHQLGVDHLTAVLLSNGPGSYTGLRIGAAAVKGLLFDRDIPLYTLCSLTSLAIPFLKEKGIRVHSVIDARREHLYYRRSETDGNGTVMQSAPEIMELKIIEKEIKEQDIVTGTGWQRMNYREKGKIKWCGSEAISACNLIEAWNNPEWRTLFEEVDAGQFEPGYLSMHQVNNTHVK